MTGPAARRAIPALLLVLLLAAPAPAQEAQGWVPEGWVEYGVKNFGRMAYRVLARGPGGAVEALDRWACMVETRESVECIYVTQDARRLMLSLLEKGPKGDYAVEVPAYPDRPKSLRIATCQTLAYAIDCPGKRQRLLWREWHNFRGELLTRIRFLREAWGGLESIQELAARVCG